MGAKFHHGRSLGSLFVFVAIVVAAASLADAGKSKFNRKLSIGDAAPVWKDLLGVDDKRHSLADHADARLVVLVFTGNRCPVSKIYDDRLLAFARQYAEKQVEVVAINVDRGEANVMKAMKARAADRMYPFSYLHDGTQESARSYGATVTPHFFVLDADRKIAYMGAFDDHITLSKVEKTYLRDAVEALLAGKAPRVSETLQRGCEIAYDSTPAGEEE
jgi:thiol-disulfide isomerase/thioredoxin